MGRGDVAAAALAGGPGVRVRGDLRGAPAAGDGLRRGVHDLDHGRGAPAGRAGSRRRQRGGHHRHDRRGGARGVPNVDRGARARRRGEFGGPRGQSIDASFHRARKRVERDVRRKSADRRVGLDGRRGTETAPTSRRARPRRDPHHRLVRARRAVLGGRVRRRGAGQARGGLHGEESRGHESRRVCARLRGGRRRTGRRSRSRTECDGDVDGRRFVRRRRRRRRAGASHPGRAPALFYRRRGGPPAFALRGRRGAVVRDALEAVQRRVSCWRYRRRRLGIRAGARRAAGRGGGRGGSGRVREAGGRVPAMSFRGRAVAPRGGRRRRGRARAPSPGGARARTRRGRG
mmetsp:Transcript_14580/g.61485  ORF Transcript_14580/g.61485 Transcript_14580/m.61485 type:complete len:346 (+) Transcript_14580:760-1797(+)